MIKNIKNKNAPLIIGLSKLGDFILSFPSDLNDKMNEAYVKNNWFTIENQKIMLSSIANNFLNEEKLFNWINNYNYSDTPPKKIGLVMAGNIPLVGFHDLLCVWLSGNIGLVKLSSKDEVLLPFLVQQLERISPVFKERTIFAERLNDADAIIATGSNNSARYFEYYFKDKPHIIRSSRNSVAVLDGNETNEEILSLGKDIFRYFGLGCRNVSKLYLPEGYDPTAIYKTLSLYSDISYHNKYKNNFDYNCTILLMNKTPHFANEFLILQESEAIASRIATVHYEFYKSESDLNEKLSARKNDIQCIIGKKYIPFGQSQEPSLVDYADNIDTMKFLSELN